MAETDHRSEHQEIVAALAVHIRSAPDYEPETGERLIADLTANPAAARSLAIVACLEGGTLPIPDVAFSRFKGMEGDDLNDWVVRAEVGLVPSPIPDRYEIVQQELTKVTITAAGHSTSTATQFVVWDGDELIEGFDELDDAEDLRLFLASSNDEADDEGDER